jgi:hypothetical protein
VSEPSAWPREVYVVRSAEIDPVHYGAVPDLRQAKALIAYLEEDAEIEGDYEAAFDYDVVRLFPSAFAAMEQIETEKERNR